MARHRFLSLRETFYPHLPYPKSTLKKYEFEVYDKLRYFGKILAIFKHSLFKGLNEISDS